MKWFRVIWIGIALIAITGGWLAGSASGLNALLALAQKASPIPITVARAEGRLWNDITLYDLRFDAPAATVEIERLRLQWRLPRLLGAVVQVHALEADGVKIVPHAATETSDSSPTEVALPLTLPDIELPLTINLERLAVRDVSVEAATPLHIESVDATASYNSAGINIASLAVALKQGGAQLQGRLDPTGDYPTLVNAQWQWRDPNFGQLAGQIEAEGSVGQLKLRHDLYAPARVTLTATANEIVENLTWNAELTLDPTDPSALRSDLPRGSVAVAVSAEGTAHSVRAKASADAAAYGLKTHSDLDIEFAEQRLRINSFRTQLMPGSGEVSANGDITIAGSDSTAKLEGNWTNLGWPLTGARQIESAAGKWQFEGGLEQFTAKIQSQLATFAPVAQDLTLHADLTGNTESLNITNLTAEAADSALNANASLVFSPSFNFDLSASWPQWKIVVDGLAQPVDLRNGSLRSHGSIDNYFIELATNTRAEGIVVDKLRVDAQGNLQQVEITSLSGGAFGGHVSGNGTVAWVPQLSWRSELQVRDVQPDRYWPEIPGQVSFDLKTEGRINGDIEARAELSSLTGQLRQQPLSGFANVSIRDGTLGLEPAYIRLGSSQFVAQGQALNAWSLSWQAELPTLSELGFGLEGEAFTAGDLAASPSGPQIALQLNARNLSYENKRVGSLSADARTVLDERLLSYLTLNGEGIDLDGTHVDQVRVTGHGNLKDHFLAGYIAQPKASLAVHARGGYAAGSWTGNLLSSMFSLSKAGQWNQGRSSQLSLSPQRVVLGATCWTRDQGQLCLDGNWNAAAPWKSTLYSAAMPLTLLEPWLPETVTTDGAFRLDGQVIGEGSTLGEAKLTLSSPQGHVDFLVDDAEKIRVDYSKARIDGRWQADGLTLNAGIKLKDDNSVNARLRLGAAPGDPLLNAPLDGRLSFKANFLGVLPALVPAVDKTQGTLRGSFTVGGTMEDPEVAGSAVVDNGLISIAQAGVTLHDIGLKLNTDNNAMRYAVSAHSGPGQIDATGTVDWSPGEAISTSMLITGHDFEVMNTAEYHIQVAPELSITSAANATNVVGTVEIPLAKLRPKQFGGAVTPSSDVVIVDKEKANGTPMEMTSIVRLALGDKVDFEGFGLKAKFAGDIVVMDSPKQLTSAHGEIRVTQGEYSAFGEKLDVKRGRLVFLGGIIDDPGLDIRASRDIRGIEDVVVGVNVQGTLRDPRMSVYTVPPKSESDALSYLMFGRPMQRGSSDEGVSVYSAANSAAFAGGAFVAKQVATSIGLEIEDLELSAQGYAVGKYLSPKLYVSYGRDIIEQVNVFKIRYILSSRWALEGDSGKGQGADILYTLEKD